MKKIITLLLPFLLAGCQFFSTTKEVELIPFKQKDKFGYFDLKGKIVINPQFSYASAFRDGIALVQTSGKDSKWGYIDTKGKFVINPSFKDATVFQDGLAWTVIDNSAPSAIDSDGEIKFTLKDAEEVRLYAEGLAGFSKADSTSVIWGFVDKTGNQTINPQFKAVGDFSDGKCAVQNKEGKWGYIDKSGKIIINYQFDNAHEFIKGKAVVYLDDKAGVIDQDGKYIINPQFQYAYVDGDNYLIYQDDKVGWCDKEGKFIINPQFESGGLFNGNDFTNVKSSDKCGYIDKEGKFTINPQFEEATAFFNEVALVKTGDKYGLIDTKGKYIVNPQFEDIGFDFYSFLAGYSMKNAIGTDFLDTDKILKVINIDHPENLSFTDDFQSILLKMNKSITDFNAYNDTHLFIEDKAITNEASYSFAVMGKVKEFNPYTYDYYPTKEKPQGFIYLLSLKGKAEGKAEAVEKAFEKKLKNFSLLKKGFVDNIYTSVYKSPQNIVVIAGKDHDRPLIYILKKDFDISRYLKKIVAESKPAVSYDSFTDSTAVEAVDTTAAAVADTTAYYK